MQLSEHKRPIKGYSFIKQAQLAWKSFTNSNKLKRENRQIPTYKQYELSDEILTEYKTKIGYYR